MSEIYTLSLHDALPISKLEQRNGRIDRHGQPRDVTIHYFVSDQDQDLAFLAHVVRKANDIREDLGSANELFDAAAHRDRKSTRLNSSHGYISYAVFCLK